MLGSLYSAISGLQSHQTKMNVIGNNIANVNTYGFKGSRVTFSDVFYQTLSAPSGSDESTGGTNPAQLGYGATVSSVDVLHTQAGSATTDRPLDVYINGEGFLAVKATSGQVYFTRTGNLTFDASGNLVDNNGNMVLGLAMDPTSLKPQLNEDGTTDTSNLIPIQINPEQFKEYSEISIDKTGAILGIKEGDPVVTKAPGTGWLESATVPETSLYSGKVMLTVERVNNNVQLIPGTGIAGVTVPPTANINGEISIERGGAVGAYTYTLNYTQLTSTQPGTATGVINDPVGAPNLVSFTVPATPAGTTTVTVNVGGGAGGVTIPANDVDVPLGTVTAAAGSMSLTFTTYNKAGDTITNTYTAYDPADPLNQTIPAGELTFKVDGTKLGVLRNQTDTTIASVGPGDSTLETIGRIAINKFVNANGLTQSGSGYYLESSNSGAAICTIPGDAGTGGLVSGALEMSNVDLSEQFTEMITTQRGFQANTRMITVSDAILEELVNMKR